MKALVILITQKNNCKTYMPGQVWLHMHKILSLGRSTKTGLDHIVTFRLTSVFHSKFLETEGYDVQL